MPKSYWTIPVLHDAFNKEPLHEELGSRRSTFFTVLATSPQQTRYDAWQKRLRAVEFTVMDSLSRKELEAIV